MHEYSIKSDFGIIDLDDIDKVERILEKIIVSDVNVGLDLFSVIIGYPGTSMIVDRVLFQLENFSGKKSLILKTDFYQNEEELLNAVFWGSSYFKIEVYNVFELNELKRIISDRLQKANIAFRIEVYNQKNNLVNAYELLQR